MSRALDFFLSPAPPDPPPPPARVPRKQRTRAYARQAPSAPASPTRAPSSAAAGPVAFVPGLSPRAVPAASAPEPAARALPPPVATLAPELEAVAHPGPVATPAPELEAVALPGPVATPAPEFEAVALRVVTGAAVVGRPREAEPVAAALALALRRETRAKAATVAVIGPPLPGGSGGGGAGRRLATRLEAEGLEPRVRGRLAWVRLDPADPELPALAWQLALVAAPVVLAVTAPRTAVIDAALADQDLVVLVTSDVDGPLAAAAMAGLPRVATTAPLARGLARELSRAGLRPPPAIRRLVEAPARSER